VLSDLGYNPEGIDDAVDKKACHLIDSLAAFLRR
jgi:hypothetical protein